MKFDSSHAKHKLFIVALLMLLFAVPFAWQWHSLTGYDNRPIMAGGAVVANSAQHDQPSLKPATNHVAQADTAAGSSFTGVLAQ